MVQSNWRKSAILALIIFAINLALNLPLLSPGELPFRDSIEGGYASMARFFAAHPNPWGWNPTQYCGLPTQFTYLPLLHYTVGAAHAVFPFADLEHVYRLVTVSLTMLGPVTVFLLALFFTKSRKWAFGVAITYTLFSPVYGLIAQIDHDRGLVQLPWRIQVLAKYGEGPHNATLTLLPLTILALWQAATKGRFAHIFLAAILLAATALTNWVGALALAWCVLVLLFLAAWHRKQTGFRVVPVLVASLIAYGMACFWLTPTFIKTIVFNWPKDAFNYQLRMQQVYLIAGFAIGVVVLWLLCRLFRREPYLGFLLLSLFGFAFIVLGFYWYGKDTIPESRRYAMEFEMFLLLAAFECLRLIVRSGKGYLLYPALGVVVLLYSTGVRQAFHYLTNEPQRWQPIAKEYTREHTVASWLAGRNTPGRVYASGGLRFRMNSWFETPQVGGGFETGLRNRVPIDFAYQIRTGLASRPDRESQDAVNLLRTLGVEYVVVHGPKSEEHYRDFTKPTKFDGYLEEVYNDHDDKVYRVPFQSLAALVRGAELPPDPVVQVLDRYAGAFNDPSRTKLSSSWQGPTRLRVAGSIPEDMLVSVAVNFDEGWSATQDGRPLTVGASKLGFILLQPRAKANSDILLQYGGTREQKFMALLSLLTWLGCFALLWKTRQRQLG